MITVYLHSITLNLAFFAGFLAVANFIKTPGKNSYADLGSDFLFNWTHSIPDSDIIFIKWYPSDSSGGDLGQVTMTLGGGGGQLGVFNPRASHVSNAVMLLKNISFTDEGYFACHITYSGGKTLDGITFLHVTSEFNYVSFH